MNFSNLGEYVTPEKLETLDPEQLKELYGLIRDYKIYQKYNRIEFTSPFDYQETFFNAGKVYKHRYLSAANR